MSLEAHKTGEYMTPVGWKTLPDMGLYRMNAQAVEVRVTGIILIGGEDGT